MKRLLLICACLVPLAGCASPPRGSGLLADQSAWQPTIDQAHVNHARYEQDLAECRAYAVNTKGTNGVAEGKKTATKFGLGYLGLVGVAALATGGLAFLPAMAGGMAVSGGSLAAAGGLTGKTMADQKYRGMISSCLAGRGYHVLG